MKKRSVLSCSLVLLTCMVVGMSLPAQAQYYMPQVQPPVYYQQNAAPQQYQYQYVQPMPQTIYPADRSCGGYWNTERCMYQQALQMVYAKQYYGAIQAFAQFLQYYPRTSLADNAMYWTGECYYAMKQYQVALSYFEQIPYQYPRGNKVPDALLKTALSYFSLKQNARGCQALNQLMTRFPNSESARKGYRWTNRCYGGGGGGGCYYPCYPTPYSSGYQGQSSYYDDYSFPKNY